MLSGTPTRSVSELLEILDNFVEILKNSPDAAVLLLGNALMACEASSVESEKNAIGQKIQDLKNVLQSEQVISLWNKLNDAKVTSIMDKSNIKTFDTAMYMLLRDKMLLQYIDSNVLLQSREISCREVLIALIRQHLFAQNLSDPFDTFDYHSLEQAGADQNYPYVAKFIKKCASLPIQSIIQLAKSEKIAETILKDMGFCADYFEISAALAIAHEGLASKIAQTWSSLFQNYPCISKDMKITLESLLKKLQGHYPEEFAGVTIHNAYIERDIPMGASEEKTMELYKKMGAYLGIGGVATYGVSQVVGIAATTTPVATSTCTTGSTLGACVAGAGATLGLGAVVSFAAPLAVPFLALVSAYTIAGMFREKTIPTAEAANNSNRDFPPERPLLQLPKSK